MCNRGGEKTLDGKNNMGPLSGVKVLEMGSLIAGPFCTRILAEFGAEVIKIELPKNGDPIRKWRVMHNDNSIWWYVQSRNKKCITLDCRKEEGLAVVKELLKDCDVLVENFKPGTIAKWGLTPEVLEEINPKLIVCHISGYGQSGPYSNRPGFGVIGEAMGGLLHLTGYPDRPPARAGMAMGDHIASLYSVIGILMSLYHRDRNGDTGQEIDVALYESVFSLMEAMVSEYDMKGVVRKRTGFSFPGIAPSNLYPTKDQKAVIIAANADGIFQRLLKLIGRDDLIGDERFVTNELRSKHVSFLDEIIANWTSQCNLDECMDQLVKYDIPAGPIYSVEEIVHDPHYQEREMILEMDHPHTGPLKVPGVVPKLSKTPGKINWLGPNLGEHNQEIMKSIGLTDEQINRLADHGII
jgi:crotonobetainyl-CoA:carnitine CoA-transferase CaiB-like acyl-CoA transferase